MVLVACLIWGTSPAPLQAQGYGMTEEYSLEAGIRLYQQGKYDQATSIFAQLMEKAKLENDPQTLGQLYYQLGQFYADQGAEQRSLKFLLQSTELLEPSFVQVRSNNIIAPNLEENATTTYNLSMPEDATVICEVYNKVGSLYFRQGNTLKAKRYWRKAYRVAQQYNHAKALSTAYNNLGELERVKGQLDTALLYYQRALSIKAYIKDTAGMQVNWANIGDVHLERNQWEEAQRSYDQSHHLAQALKNPEALAISTLDYGNYYLQRGLLAEAQLWLYRALEFGNATQNLYTQVQAHEQIALLYERQNRLDSSLFHRKQTNALQQAIYKNSQTKLTMQIEAEYLVHEKEKQLLEVRQTAALEQEQNRRLDLLQWSGLLVLAGLLLVALVVLRWRKKHEQQLAWHLTKIQQQNQEKSTLLKEIHHRVKNNLQVITSLLGLQSLSIEDPLVQDLFQQSQRRINSMSMIHQMLYQSDHLSTINYRDYLERLVYSLVRSIKGETYDLQVDIQVPDLALNIDTAIPLGLLVNEVVTNSLKYGLNKGPESLLTVHLKSLGDEAYELRLGDNGDGIDGDWKNASSPNSLGLRLIRQLSRQLQGTIERDEHQPGLHYVLHFKKIHPTT